MEAVSTSETSKNFCETTRRSIPEGVASVVQSLVCLPLDPRVEGWNLTEAVDF
jgi:hypothetical protein